MENAEASRQPTRRKLRRKLMPAFVDVVKVPGVYADTLRRGLVLKVTPAGEKRYAVRYVVGARQRFYTIGDATTLTLGEARKEADRVLARVELGEDPLEDRKRSRKAGTVKELAKDWLKSEDSKRWRPATRRGFVCYIDGDIVPGLGTMKLPDVTRADLRRLIRDKGKPDARGRDRKTASNRLFEVCRMLFRWAVKEDMLQHSPCDGLGKLFDDPVRQRAYTPEEIQAILAAVPGTELELLVPVLFHTGTRSEETRAMRWRDVDLEVGEWRIPAEDAKTGEPRTVALSTGVVALLKPLRDAKVKKLSPFVFPAPTAAGYMDQPNACVKRLKRPAPKVAADLDGKFAKSEDATKRGFAKPPRRLPADFRLHDIRRTIGEHMSNAGERPEVIGAVLGHILPKIDRTYRIRVPLKDQREALERWSTKLAAIPREARG